jgi:hypothetical protein
VDLPLKALAGPAKMDKMEKLLVRMENCFVRMKIFALKMEKIIVCALQILSCYLKAVPHGLSSGHKERA